MRCTCCGGSRGHERGEGPGSPTPTPQARLAPDPPVGTKHNPTTHPVLPSIVCLSPLPHPTGSPSGKPDVAAGASQSIPPEPTPGAGTLQHHSGLNVTARTKPEGAAGTANPARFLPPQGSAKNSFQSKQAHFFAPWCHSAAVLCPKCLCSAAEGGRRARCSTLGHPAGTCPASG